MTDNFDYRATFAKNLDELRELPIVAYVSFDDGTSDPESPIAELSERAAHVLTLVDALGARVGSGQVKHEIRESLGVAYSMGFHAKRRMPRLAPHPRAAARPSHRRPRGLTEITAIREANTPGTADWMRWRGLELIVQAQGRPLSDAEEAELEVILIDFCDAAT